MFIGVKIYHLTMMTIFYCLCTVWAMMSLSGCNQSPKNIPSEITLIIGQEKPSNGLTEESVADTADIEEDLTENSKPTNVFAETGSDHNLSGLEEIRLKAAQMLASSHFYIFFETNSNELSRKAIEKLDRIYKILSKKIDAKLTLNGYSDSIGALSINQMVSEVRAYSVKSYLSGRGIKPSRIMALGHGAEKSLASNKIEEGRRLNRRVEIDLTIP